MNHTPAPWTVWTFDEDPRHLYVGPQAGGLAIADVVACNAHGCYTAETEDRGRANAQLIAAAPAMLEALEALNSAVCRAGHGSASMPELAQAWAAIALAYGKTAGIENYQLDRAATSPENS